MANSFSLFQRSSDYLVFPHVCFAYTHHHDESTKKETHKACVARGRGQGRQRKQGAKETSVTRGMLSERLFIPLLGLGVFRQ